jgi:hypothetical protein
VTRTLVVSDLHLGGRAHHSVLAERGPALERLVAAIGQADRLVLLGDTIELLEGRPRRSLQDAAPVLKAIGAAVGRERELILVLGNHDRPLVRAWVRSVGAQLRPDGEVPPGAGAGLRQVLELLAPARRVRVHYPGVWLAEGVWATHGHYLDLHLIPVSTYGVARGLLARRPGDRARPADYERGRRPAIGPALGFLPASLGASVERLAELARAATMPLVRGGLLHPGFAPLTSRLLSLQMRRASMPALARVVHRLEIGAEWVLFGHVHRLGPLPEDEPERWRGPGGRPQMANSGSWVWEPLLVSGAKPPHPYWPGGAVWLDGPANPPRAAGLLDDLDAAVLAPR